MKLNQKAHTDSNNIVHKIAAGKQASYTDEPLTPPKKMAAEQMRMQQQQQEQRQEEDKQLTSLGGAILTPQKKMEQAQLEVGAKAQGKLPRQ